MLLKILALHSKFRQGHSSSLPLCLVKAAMSELDAPARARMSQKLGCPPVRQTQMPVTAKAIVQGKNAC